MNAADLEELFVDSGALLKGHFQLSSGRHSAQYFQCALLLSDTKTAASLGTAVADKLPAPWGRVDTVVGPALGGLIIGHETARALGARGLFTERKNGEMALRRGFAVSPGEKIVIVEDVITTGKSTGEVVRLLTSLGAEVVGALCIVLRGARTPDVGIPIESLAKLSAESFSAEECPLCKDAIALVKPGSRPAGKTAKG